MVSFFVVLLSVLLVSVCLFIIVLVLMQRPGENGGFGTSFDGSALESAFGGDAGSILAKITIGCVISFFAIATLLSLAYVCCTQKSTHADNLSAIAKACRQISP
ncbi:MAG: preprotein translocase subunit SecG [Puniceicoccales bacterium]|nr:preprotein translocase subunit SecG [Puniceicoccales bacterium]